MQKRLFALVAALAVTFASFGSAALENADEQIAQLTESIYNVHSHQEVVLAEEGYDTHSEGMNDPCLDTEGNWICDDEYIYEDTYKDPCIDPSGAWICDDEEHSEESHHEEEHNEDHKDDYYEEEDYYHEDPCIDSTGMWVCDDVHHDPCVDPSGSWVCDGEEEHYEEEWTHYEADHYYHDYEDAYEDHYDHQAEEIGRMVAELEMKLKDLELFLEDIRSMNDGSSNNIQESLDALEELIDGGFELLDTMHEKIEQGLSDEAVGEFWEMLDYIRQTADQHMRSIEDELKIDGGFEFHEEPHYDDKYFEDHYGGDYHYEEFFKDFNYEDAQHVTHEVPEELMHELVEHVENPYAQALSTSVMNNLDVLDDDAVKFLEYSSELFDVMADVEVPDENDPKYDRLKELYEKSFVLLTEDVREELIATWLEIKSAVEAGATESQLNSYAEQIEALLKENTDALVMEEGIGYYDVNLHDDDWYFDDVQELKDEGVIGGFKDEHGQATGYFGPSELITKAEMLKLVLEVSQKGEVSSSPSDSTAHGQWYEGYVSQFENMGMSYGGNWNAPITRRVAAVWISEAMDLHEKVDSYSGEFGDVSSADDDALHFAAVYEYGVFTGDSGTGNLRAEDNMNRAEAAKVVRTAMSEVLDRAADSVNETIDSFMDSYSQ